MNTNFKSVAVIGAGIAGLSIAHQLQRRNHTVSIYDHNGVAGGASKGNAGWITPSLAQPINSLGLVKQGAKEFFKPNGAIRVPSLINPATFNFLSRFILNSSQRKWTKNSAQLNKLNQLALESFHELSTEVGFPTTSGAYHAAFSDQQSFRAFFDSLKAHSQGNSGYSIEEVSSPSALDTIISPTHRYRLTVSGELFIDPLQLCKQLSQSLVEAGGEIHEDEVLDIATHGNRTTLLLSNGGQESYDYIVVACGAWLGQWRSRLGIQPHIIGGRGYSFSVPLPPNLDGAVYFPDERIVCTPMQERLRISALLDIESPESFFNAKRLQAVLDTSVGLLPQIQPEEASSPWVGSRPLTSDGLPVIGESTTPNVFIHGGHGMWGVTQSIVSSRLLADSIVQQEPHPLLTGFDPQRRWG